jgi:hypothetical protein
LRHEAADAGTLQSTPQQIVTNEGSDIVIQPADPNVVYVPVYDPGVVYGGWPYPDYPPYYFPPPPGYPYGGALAVGIGFGIGFGIVGPFWGWDDFDWDRHRVHIDRDRFDDLDRHHRQRSHREAGTGDTWQHDPDHRRGDAYKDPASQQRYLRPAVGTPFPTTSGGSTSTDRRLHTLTPGQGETPTGSAHQQTNTQMPTVLRGGTAPHTPTVKQVVPQGGSTGAVQAGHDQGGRQTVMPQGQLVVPQGQHNATVSPSNPNRGVQDRRPPGSDNRTQTPNAEH